MQLPYEEQWIRYIRWLYVYVTLTIRVHIKIE